MTETINIPRESTMQEIAKALQTMAFVQAGQASNITGWDNVSGLVRNRYADKVFGFGDQFVEKWIDTADNKEYEYPWQVNHFEDVELEDGETAPGMFLQAHYAHPFGVQFSHQRAFLACPEGLAAGTYYFTIESSWGNNVKSGDVVCFTTTKDVPAGGKVSGCYGAPAQAKANWRIYTHSADGTTILETITPTFEASGTNLGTQKHNSRNGNLNSTQEMAYGWNRWKTSALRQYLNSNKTKGNWWVVQDEWDIAPDQLTTKDGFLCGMPADMLKALKTVKVVTYANTVQDGGDADITYDKVFLPSLEQMYINPQISGEGTYHEYWKLRSGSKTKLQQYQTYPNIITYAVENHNSPQNVRLRSAYRGYAYDTWSVHSDGYVHDWNYASNASRFSPLVVL